METLQQYKCPCCDGAIEFDPRLQKMRCPYCDTEFDVATVASFDEMLKQEQALPDQMQWQTQAGQAWEQGESEGLRVYTCQSCGGEIVTDETTGATECPFCGNPVVMMGQFAGGLKPDLVIPFRLDKKAAIAALKKHYEGKRLLPKVFKDENHLREMKGLYVPVWLFDANAQADVRYKGTQVRTWSDSRFDYTQTSHYVVSRSGWLQFTRLPVDGSSKMDNTLMESIEPYDHSQAVDFRTAYLSGYLADKYDEDAQSCIARANERIKRSTEDAFAATANGYTTLTPDYSSVRLSQGRTQYALYPVWLLNTKWNGKTYTFAMNGQTGKLVGDLPMDKKIYHKWLYGIMVAVSAAAFALSYLLWLL